MNFIGLDIGGANLKIASTNGDKREVAFAFWKNKDQLVPTLAKFRDIIGPDDSLGVTMTAELADCFENKQSGVAFVVESVLDAFAANTPLFYRTDGTMTDGTTAIKTWPLVAASNWHALASLAFEAPMQNSGFVFDIGSTTTDIIPVSNGKPLIECQDDLARLKSGQLHYAGIGRTPICGLLDQVKIGDESIGIAREFFATTNDALICFGDVSPDNHCFDTADGRSRSVRNAKQRIARMICCDAEEIGNDAVQQIAVQARAKLIEGITHSLLKVVNTHAELPRSFVTFGGGASLAKKIIETQKENLGNHVNTRSFSDDRLTNQTAPAFAVAKKRQAFFFKHGV